MSEIRYDWEFRSTALDPDVWLEGDTVEEPSGSGWQPIGVRRGRADGAVGAEGAEQLAGREGAPGGRGRAREAQGPPAQAQGRVGWRQRRTRHAHRLDPAHRDGVPGPAAGGGARGVPALGASLGVLGRGARPLHVLPGVVAGAVPGLIPDRRLNRIRHFRVTIRSSLSQGLTANP